MYLRKAVIGGVFVRVTGRLSESDTDEAIVPRDAAVSGRVGLLVAACRSTECIAWLITVNTTSSLLNSTIAIITAERSSDCNFNFDRDCGQRTGRIFKEAMPRAALLHHYLPGEVLVIERAAQFD